MDILSSPLSPQATWLLMVYKLKVRNRSVPRLFYRRAGRLFKAMI
jgi:hypothetical protein